jgi:hypothetical protein
MGEKNVCDVIQLHTVAIFVLSSAIFESVNKQRANSVIQGLTFFSRPSIFISITVMLLLLGAPEPGGHNLAGLLQANPPRGSNRKRLSVVHGLHQLTRYIGVNSPGHNFGNTKSGSIRSS